MKRADVPLELRKIEPTNTPIMIGRSLTTAWNSLTAVSLSPLLDGAAGPDLFGMKVWAMVVSI